jgi:hypothetical protein
VISEAGLRRLLKAAEDAGNVPRATVEVADVFSVVNTVRELRRKDFR